jgi:hypothetical protein
MAAWIIAQSALGPPVFAQAPDLPAVHPSPGEDTFALGVVTGRVVPASELPVGLLEITLRDASDRPLVDHKVQLGLVEGGHNVHMKSTSSDREGVARFRDLATGSGTSYAAVIEHDDMRFGIDGFRMPEAEGLRGEIRVLERTSDPLVLRLGLSSKIVLEVGEDSLSVMQQLTFENMSTRIFDPGPDGLLVPLGEGFRGAQVLEGGAPTEPGAENGVFLKTIIPPNSGSMFPTHVRVGYVLPVESNGTVALRQPMPQGMQNPLLLVPESTRLTLTAAGLRRLPDQADNKGAAIRMYELPAIAPGGMLAIAVAGVPYYSRTGRIVVAVLCTALLGAGIFAARRPRSGQKKRAGTADVDIHDRREELFAELVSVERARRQAQPGAGNRHDAQRREIVSKLETVYRELARVDRGGPPL